MNSISVLTRSLDRNFANAAFADIQPDFVRTGAVTTNNNIDLLSSNPLEAGNEFHRLLNRMGDTGPLSPKERAYWPWVHTLRATIWGLGAWEMEIESSLAPMNNVPCGIADLVVSGGPTPHGIIEAKVITRGKQLTPRGRDLAQLGSYARLLAGRQMSYDNIWSAVAYIELESKTVRVFGYTNSRKLIFKSLDLLQAA